MHKVTEVIDGDTVVLDNGEHVRYLGIDTPEIHHPTKPKQCYGEEAAKRNQELVEGKYVFLERDKEDRDKYNRLLRYVYVGFTSINAELVREGFAYSYYFPPISNTTSSMLNWSWMQKKRILASGQIA